MMVHTLDEIEFRTGSQIDDVVIGKVKTELPVTYVNPKLVSFKDSS